MKDTSLPLFHDATVSVSLLKARIISKKLHNSRIEHDLASSSASNKRVLRCTGRIKTRLKTEFTNICAFLARKFKKLLTIWPQCELAGHWLLKRIYSFRNPKGWPSQRTVSGSLYMKICFPELTFCKHAENNSLRKFAVRCFASRCLKPYINWINFKKF